MFRVGQPGLKGAPGKQGVRGPPGPKSSGVQYVRWGKNQLSLQCYSSL